MARRTEKLDQASQHAPKLHGKMHVADKIFVWCASNAQLQLQLSLAKQNQYHTGKSTAVFLEYTTNLPLKFLKWSTSQDERDNAISYNRGDEATEKNNSSQNYEAGS